MLKNTAEALVNVKNESVDKIKMVLRELKDYATGEKILTGQACDRVVAALPNSDTDGMLEALVKGNPAGVVAGIAAITKAVGAKSAVLIIRSAKNRDELQASAATAGLNLEIVESQMVNKREFEQDQLIHIETAAAAADLMIGKIPGIVIAVNEEPPIEVAFGISLGEVVSINNLKAISYEHHFYDVSRLEESLEECQVYGSGVIRTFTDQNCLVQAMQKELMILRQKSCGKCTFCREGLYQLSTIVDEMTKGLAKMTDWNLAKEIADAMELSTNCSLGRDAAAPVHSAYENFANEVEAHITKKECPAGECLAFTHIYVDPAKCNGCGECIDACPKSCIEGKEGYIAMIDEFDCSKCGECMGHCKTGAIISTSKRVPKLPNKLTRVKGSKAAVSEEKKNVKKSKSLRRRQMAKIMPLTNIVEETEKIEERKPKEGIIMKKLETDVIVVAGGPAGLAAAITAGENNLKSILFEKSSTTGGAANMGMGPLGIDTKVQKRDFNNISVKEALDMHMKYTHYRVDEDLVQTYFNKSADTIEWLEEMGVEFAGAFRYFKESEATWHIVKPENGVIGPRAAGAMVRKMTERAKELGTEILLETPVISLIQEDGKVCGVIAEDKDGNQIEARAKAVVVATGGFGNNKEMVKKEFGLNMGVDYFPFMIPGINGDGLNMMWKAGAAKFGQNIEAIYQLADNLSWMLLDAALRQPNLLINQFGERFMNEGDMGNTTFTGNALSLQPGNYGYCIMDESILKYYKKNGPDIFDIVHPADCFLAFEGQAAKAVEQGYEGYIEADTVEELAKKLGIDAEVLQDTFDEYNEMCETGVDTKFHKQPEYLHPITGKGKYLVGKFYLGAYGTIGGVRINKYCEVLDENSMPIEGLYSAGTDANTIYGDSYNFTLPGNSMGFAVNSGRMAGESIADYVASLNE
ncbi:fumarate reductase flavoprotein subunit [Lachnospiraceae bacterium KM106-2]|nr:fumarate reductase flavoprotein subunit [Lachnospiraceae bacterium KM106-2]